MKNKIYYFTGTGNSLAIARKLAKRIGECEIIPIAKALREKPEKCDVMGIVVPNYSFDVPHMVAQFFKRITDEKSYNYLFVTVSAGGDFGFITQKIQKRLKGAELSAVFQHYMPFNYTPFGDVPSEERQMEMFNSLEAELSCAVDIIRKRKRHFDDRYLPTSKYMQFIYALAYPLIPQLDRLFSCTKSCNGCGICEKVCVVNNIEMKERKPHWKHHCEHCYACLHWCPERSILCGSKSRVRSRYHHPDVTVQDIIM